MQFLAAAIILAVFSIFGVVVKWIPMSKNSRRRLRIYFTHYLARGLAYAIKVKIDFRSEAESQIGKLIVANHTSVLDAIVLAARSPCVFVTSTETEENFFLEFLARTGGGIFIERRSRTRISYDQEQIRKLLLQGFDVVLFPEGTSTNGEEVRPFKSGLLPAATEVRAPIEPVLIQFKTLGGQKITESNRDQILYYGDHLIHRHLFSIFTNPVLHVEVRGLGLVRTHSQMDPKELAGRLHQKIVQASATEQYPLNSAARNNENDAFLNKKVVPTV